MDEHRLHLWRVGRYVTDDASIYSMPRDEPSSEDVLIGTMDTRELACEAVLAHNALLYPGAR